MENSEFGRLIGVLVSPVKTFQSIERRPTWVAAFVVLVVLGGAVGLLALDRVDMGAATRQQLEERGDMKPEQIEAAAAAMEKFGLAFGLIGVATSVAINFLLGLIFWVAFRMLGSEITYSASLSTTLHGLMPNAVGALVAIPVILGQQSLDLEAVQQGRLLASNLSFLAGEDTGKGLVSVLASLDLFSLWSVALLAIGFAAVARVSRGAAWGTVLVLWLLYVLGKIGIAAAFG